MRAVRKWQFFLTGPPRPLVLNGRQETGALCHTMRGPDGWDDGGMILLIIQHCRPEIGLADHPQTAPNPIQATRARPELSFGGSH